MPVRTVKDAAAASAALSAFLRGVERRGAVFAHLQAGDGEDGMAALATAMAGFRAAASRTPFGDWPRRFWGLLLATPELREPGGEPHWPEQFQALGRVGRGPRAALLLRLVANVPEADAAAALGVSRPTYRLALRRALPRQADGGADEEAWRQLGEAAQRAVRDLAPDQLGELARMREAALQGVHWQPTPPESPGDPATRRPRWLGPALAAVVLATAGALAATVLLQPPQPDPDGGPDRITTEALSPPPAPAAAWDEDLVLLTHPDFELLVADVQDAAVSDPAFHAWLVHQVGEPEEDAGVPVDPQAPAVAEAGGPLPPQLQELAAALPEAERTRLARRNAVLQAMAQAGLADLRAHVARWDALGQARRRARRDAWQAWNRLPEDARTRMRAAAAAYAELPAGRRRELAGEFDALDASERNGWRLGPDLGADWPVLHPLLALVPADQQEELLAVLLSMDAAERADLGLLARRTPPGERDALRNALLTTPAENRAAWLRRLARP